LTFKESKNNAVLKKTSIKQIKAYTGLDKITTPTLKIKMPNGKKLEPNFCHKKNNPEELESPKKPK
jgi:hypothetical protein